MIVFVQKLFDSEKSGWIRAKILYTGKRGCIWVKVVVFGNTVVFGQK